MLLVVSDFGDDLFDDKSGDLSTGVATGAGEADRSWGVGTRVGECAGEATLGPEVGVGVEGPVAVLYESCDAVDCCCSLNEARKGDGAIGSGVKIDAAASMSNGMPGLIDRRFSALEVGTLSPLTPSPTPLGDRTAAGLRDTPGDKMLPVDAEVCNAVAIIGEAEEDRGVMGLATADDDPGVGLAVLERGDLPSVEPARAMGVSSTAGEVGTLLLRRVAGDAVRGRGLGTERSVLPSRLASAYTVEVRLRGDAASG